MLSRPIPKIQSLSWLKENNRPLSLAAAAFLLLLGANVLLYVLLVEPAVGKLQSVEVKRSTLRKRHAEAVLFQKQKPLFTGMLAGIPAQKDMPLLVKEFVSAARRLDLNVAAVNYDIPRRESGELAMLAFTFPAEGRYPDLKRFVYEVETSDRLIGIQDMKLETVQGKVKLQMKLLTYVKGN